MYFFEVMELVIGLLSFLVDLLEMLLKLVYIGLRLLWRFLCFACGKLGELAMFLSAKYHENTAEENPDAASEIAGTENGNAIDEDNSVVA